LESVAIPLTQVTRKADPDGLVQRMRRRTSQLHRLAERSGVVAELLRGQITQTAYALLLRNLLPAYQTMEQALDQGTSPLLHGIGHPSLSRTAAIEADLSRLAGHDWPASLSLLPSGQRYADRVSQAAQGDGALLIAHSYTRYLGDLSGGQIIGRRLASLFPEIGPGLQFTRFDGIPNLRDFAEAYRLALDQAGTRLSDSDRVVEEAAVAFQMNIDVSNEIAVALSRSVSTT
jgi:heme oxygenase